MSYPKFDKFLERKNPDLVQKPKMIKTGDKLTGADELAAEPNKPPKEGRPMKNGKQAQVAEQEEMPKGKLPWKVTKGKLDKGAKPEPKNESLWARFLEKKQPGTVVDKPKTEIIADYPFDPPAAPPEAKTKGKNWDAKAPKASKPAPYKQGTDAGPQNAAEGLGNLGSIPKEEIKVQAGDSKYFPGGKTVGDYSTKTEAFLQKTKDLSLGEFASLIKEERGEVNPELPHAIRQVAEAAQNANALRDIVVEFRRQDLFVDLMEALLEFPEGYEALVSLLGDQERGMTRCNALVRAMNETVGPPLGMGDEMDDDDEMGGTPPMADDEDEDEMDFPHDDEDEDEDEDEDGNPFDDEEDDEEMPDEDDEDMPPPEEDDDEDMDSPEFQGGDDMGGPSVDNPMLRKRIGFAMDHLIHALNRYLQEG